MQAWLFLVSSVANIFLFFVRKEINSKCGNSTASENDSANWRKVSIVTMNEFTKKNGFRQLISVSYFALK